MALFQKGNPETRKTKAHTAFVMKTIALAQEQIGATPFLTPQERQTSQGPSRPKDRGKGVSQMFFPLVETDLKLFLDFWGHFLKLSFSNGHHPLLPIFLTEI